MRWFSRLSIQQRLMLIILLPTVLTVCVSGAAFYVHERAEIIGALVRELHVLAEVAGENSLGAISFDDPAQAERTLSALDANPAIEAAVIVRKALPFARYELKKGAADALLLEASPLATRSVLYGDGVVAVVHPIEHLNEHIATLAIRCDLAPTLGRLNRTLAASVVVILAITVCALGLTFVLQREVSRPIDELARTMKQVHAAKDYSPRARKFGEDELGQLTDRFNEMLAAFESNREQLLAAKEAAMAGTRAKSDFLARMSHEIRTPLNAVVGLTSLLADTPLTEQQRQYVTLTRSSAEALRELVTDVLDFSKIEAGRLVLQPSDFALVQLVEETLMIFAEQIQRKGLAAACSFGPDVPRWARGDAGRLREVLMNLLSNAIKFTASGEVTVQVDAKLDESHVDLFCTVRDTGPGIPSESLSRLFLPFSQLGASDNTGQPGTGLGLAICRQLCQLMGGDIEVESRPGEGTAFRFKVVLEAVLVPPAEAPPRLVDRRILVATPTSRVAAMLPAMLTPAGAAPEPVTDAGAFRARLAEGWDALLIDLAWFTAFPDAKFPRAVVVLGAAERAGAADAVRRAGAVALGYPATPGNLAEALDRAARSEPAPAPVATLAPVAAPPPEAPPAAAVRTVHILVVDDNEINRMVATMLLKTLGYRAQAVTDGAEALKALDRGAFDLVLMDCQMPVLDGFETTRRIRASEQGQDRRLPIVAVTAAAVYGDRERCLESGMDDYLTKPIDRAALVRVLEKWLPKEPAPLA